MPNDYYVYIHYRKSDDQPFYVGKGRGDRHLSRDRNPYWKNTVKKHGFYSAIIFDDLTEEQAYSLEIETIYDLRIHGFPLTNLTDGGIGGSGHRPPKKNKRKGPDPRKGVKRSPETVEKMRASLTGKKQSFSTRLKRAMKNRDENHPSYRDAVHNFFNYETGEQVSMTMHFFCKHTGLPKGNVHRMIDGKLKTVGRWTLKGRDLSASRPVSIKHNFWHPEYGHRNCTMADLQREF